MACLQNNQQPRQACMLQHHRFISNAYIPDSVKGKDGRRRVSCMAEHVRQGSICGCLLTSILDGRIGYMHTPLRWDCAG
jgi:hypothetical protein